MYVNVVTTFGCGKSQVVTRFTIPLDQLSVWELQAVDPPYNTSLIAPVKGQVLDIGIMGLYFPVKVVVDSVTAIPLHTVLYRALQGIGDFIHNFAPRQDLPIVFSLLQAACQ